MHPEWREYWKEAFKATRSVFLALGVSLLFFLGEIPKLKKSEYLPALIESLQFGLIIFGIIWLFYAIVWAGLTHVRIKSGRSFEINSTSHIVISLIGMSVGVLLALKFVHGKAIVDSLGLKWSMPYFLTGTFISLMFYFYYSYKHSSEENAYLRAAKAESELQVLKNQMQPHFLFNSLNSLSELIETNKVSASDMAMKLSDLYREILENSKKQLAPLESEVSIIKKYLELEGLRFGKRLKYKIDVPGDSYKIFIPPLILQTLVENAVKHGIAPSVEGGKVEVSVKPNGSLGYNLIVKNTGTQNKNKKGSGTGLENTKARLDLFYGEKHNFQVQAIGNFVHASFWFPGVSANV